MATVQNHIRELLFEQDCVVIPDFGGFVTNFDCAKFDKTQEFIKPAQKWLAFNGLLKNDDGLLSNYIAKTEGISREEAIRKIRLFVEATKKSLRTDQKFNIEGVGNFTENEEGKIQFYPYENNNFLGDSFGLEKIAIRKSSIEKQFTKVEIIQPKVSQKTIQQVFASNDRDTTAEEVSIEKHRVARKKRRKSTLAVFKFLFGMVSASLFVSAIYLYDNEKNSLSSFNPFHFTQKQAPEAFAETIEKDIVESSPTVLPTLSKKDTSVKTVVKPIIIKEEKRFFVITGSFGEKENAEQQLSYLKSNGYKDASIIDPIQKGKLIKVSAGGFDNEESANQEAARIAKAINQNAWIFKK